MNRSNPTPALEKTNVTDGMLRLTVIVPCRNEERTILDTLEAIVRQRSPDNQTIWKWGEVLVIDNASTDGTRELLAEFQRGHPFMRVILNETNLGIAASMNKAIRASEAPLLVVCHADCMPLDDCVWGMQSHFADSKVAAVTGKPASPDYAKLSFEEKAYILTHLMDVEEEPPMVREINFTEGRCDAFRKSALIEVGLYNEQTKFSGEDQILAAELRQRGYRLLQDTSLRYHLSAGGSQNSARRIIQHQVPLGQGQAFILLHTGLGTAKHARTAPNRFRRRRLRMLQVIAVPGCLATLMILVLLCTAWLVQGLLLLVALRFTYLLLESRGRFRFTDVLRIFPIAVACDLTYCFGFYRGALLSLLRRSV